MTDDRELQSVLVVDVDGNFTYCSPAVESALGYLPSELTGTNERDLIHSSDLAVHDGLVGRLVASDDQQPPIELRLHDRSGAWHWFETTSTEMPAAWLVSSSFAASASIDCASAA